MAVGKVQVRNYNKRDGTHVKSYTREQSSSLGASGELPPEDEYDLEATVTGEMDGDGNVKDTKVKEVKIKPKEDDRKEANAGD